MCDKKCDEEGFKFYDIAPILVEDDGKPHTINLCRNCYDHRLTESGETKVTNAVRKEMIRRKVSRGRLSAAFGSDGLMRSMCERFTAKKELGK